MSISTPTTGFRHLSARADAFIAAATVVHGVRYDYTRVPFEYTNAHSPVTIGCPDHGRFSQSPNEHRRGQLCPDCARLVRAANFINKANEVHTDRYDYGGVVFVDQRTPVTIECAEHGSYEQRPTNHLDGRGCRECADRDRLASVKVAGKKRRRPRRAADGTFAKKRVR